MRKLVNTSVISILLGFSFISCSTAISHLQQSSEIKAQEKQERILMPSDSSHFIYSGLNRITIVYDFYQSRSFEPMWISDSSNALTDSLLTFLKSVRFYGLLPQDYHLAQLEKLGGQEDSLYRREALLTDSFLSLMNDLKYGRLDSTVSHSRDSLILKILQLGFENHRVRGVLEAQEPPHDRYQELKKALRQLLNKADSVNFNLLMTGLTYECIDLHKKVQCIEVNMERWRSEKNLMQRKYIWINIPAFQLQVVDNGRFVIESRIIVGKTESQTPVLSSTIEFITLFPYWRVPRKIAIQEYLPIIQNDTSFLKLNNFEVLDKKGNILDPATIKWQDFNPQYFPVSLRQQEGIENSLGIIKFVFDNPYAVFLHDTNVKSLFRKKTRAFSHGCIRMEKALDLAKYLAPNRTMVEEKISAKEQCTITLANPVAIYTRYFTCEYVNGRLNFYEDVYSLDKALIDLLYKKEIETICCDQTY